MNWFIITDHFVLCLRTGNLAALTLGTSVLVFDVFAKKTRSTFTFPSSTQAVCMSSDGKYIGKLLLLNRITSVTYHYEQHMASHTSVWWNGQVLKISIKKVCNYTSFMADNNSSSSVIAMPAPANYYSGACAFSDGYLLGASWVR
jgi:hypothetical protein